MGAPDELDAARATAVLRSHVRIHLAKEDIYLYPILGQRIKPEEQGPIVGQMASKVPPQLMPQFVDWLFHLVEQEDRATMTAVWKALMPEEVFVGVKPLIQGSSYIGRLVRTDKARSGPFSIGGCRRSERGRGRAHREVGFRCLESEPRWNDGEAYET